MQVCETACISRLLFDHLYDRLHAEGISRPLVETEMPLVAVLAAMEAIGVAFDQQVLEQVKVSKQALHPYKLIR